MTEGALQGRVILVAEDEYLIAADLARELDRAGARVLGPVASLERTLGLIEETDRIDAAILDVNLQGEPVFPAAQLLRQRAVPFLFATGYDRSALPPPFDAVLRCEKPIASEKLSHALTELISG